MSAKRKMSEWVKNYKELLLFLLFSLFCAFEAAGRGLSTSLAILNSG